MIKITDLAGKLVDSVPARARPQGKRITTSYSLPGLHSEF